MALLSLNDALKFILLTVKTRHSSNGALKFIPFTVNDV